MEIPRKEAPTLNPNDEIKFQIIDWYIPESDRQREKSEEPDIFTMMIYGSTQNGHTVCANITGYQPYFYIKPPAEWEQYSDIVFASKVAAIESELENGWYKCTFKNRDNGSESKYNKKIIPRGYDEHLVSVSVVKKKEFWGFTNNKDFRFIKVIVKSLALFNNLKYYFQSLKPKGFTLYESNIDPFLRYIHEQNIKPCGWVSIKEYEINDDNDTRCDYNIQTSHENVITIDVNNIAPLLIASFDIECSSSHGDFPVAKKDYRKVAQDLANIAKAGYDITEEFILYWLESIYTSDTIIDDDLKVHRIYPKHKVVFANYKDRISNISNQIIEILNKIADIAVDSDEDDDDDKKASKRITVKEQNVLEAKLNKLLSDILPPLKGDKIIQIGTTVHRYGSDEIIYKNIITLNTCNPIENTDVITCATEKEVLMQWKNLMVSLNPDILTGYNIFGFDMEYIWIRAQECNIIDEFSCGLGRKITRKCTLVRQELSSSALGENILKYFDMDGTVVIDLFKVMQREHKLDSYKLDNVANIFIGDKKDDLKPHEIFEKFFGTAEDRCIIAKYCVQDCALVNRLLHKLKILENNIGMGNVCLVPLNYLFKRGQGIKIFSLIAKQCMDRGHLIPVIRAFDPKLEIDSDGYEGAVVLEPKEGIYLNDPIVVFDYGSLYPSSMIARNLSHDCYVIDQKYMVDDPNVDYIKVCYDLYEGLGDKKRKSGVKECIFAQYKDGRKGIIADILCMLLQERKNTRKKMEYKTIILKDGKKLSGVMGESGDNYELVDTDTNAKIIVSKREAVEVIDTFNKFEQDVFDALQLAYKITANSLYGQIGAKTSPVYLKDIAACTTATGREMIMLAKKFVEDNYNAEVIYGDSVMPYTPITYKTSHQIYVSTFETLDGSWTPYNEFKNDEVGRYNKEQFQPNDIHVWTHKGWAKVKRIIRHKTIKKIYRVSTLSGMVDITEDHSLLDDNAEIIKPVDCSIGQKLLHSQPLINSYNQVSDSYQAYVYGQFVANGRMYQYNDVYGNYYIWEICNKNFDILKKCKIYLETIENIKFVIIYRNREYVLMPVEHDNINMLAEKYKCCYHDDNVCKIVPHKILNGTPGVMMRFKQGLDDASGSSCYIIDCMHQITAQTHVLLLQILKYHVKMTTNENTIIIKIINSEYEYDKNIRNIEVLHEKYHGYVYDIETESGVFHGGIGNLILKNTDSIFCKFPLKDANGNNVYGKDSLQYAIEIGKHVEKNITSIMPNPQKLNYEKSLYPFILFSKKRYVGNLYETCVDKFKQKSMGIVLKRRDNAPIVKKIYGGIIDILLNNQDLHESIQFLKDELQDLVDGKSPITELIISKSLRASYKDASKIPHKVLADRIGERDPGNKPQVNDRVPFVYIKVPDAKLQGDRIENPEYIVENNLTPDYLHYITNQIMNPVLQLYALCLDELPNYDKADNYWHEVDTELKKKPMYQDDIKRKNRVDNLKLNMVKELLFDEFINMLCEPKLKKVRKEPVPKTNTKKDDENMIVDANITNASNTIASKTRSKKQKTQHTTNNDSLIAEIKVIQKKDTKIIESVAKIYKGNEVIWEYKNNKNKDKTKEIINIIVNMIPVAKEHNIKLSIKVNYKQFATDYTKSLSYFKELEKASRYDDTVINTAVQENDIGIIKNVSHIIPYESIICLSDYFEIAN
jgi:DNA polymerase elongation subunit (family B)